jgi:tetratricopeptide (TPR) repeat protein
MPDEKNQTPDLWEEVRAWAYAHYGSGGLAAIVVAGLIFYIWTHWGDVKKWPGAAWLIEYFTRQPVPKAEPARFSVMVARLADDEQGEYATLIAALLAEFQGIQILSLDRTIEMKDAGENKTAGHMAARTYLEESGASILIWGRVLRFGGETRPQLNITTALGHTSSPQQYPLETETEFRLPALLWRDLVNVLLFLIFSFDEGINKDRGHYVADRLPLHIARVHQLVIASADRPEWDSDTRGSILVILASALRIMGNQTGSNQPLEEAIEAYRAAIIERPRDRIPLKWAMLHINLGVTFQELGTRNSGTEYLKQSVEAYHMALMEITRVRIPFVWATTQNNLGNALIALGERENGTERFKQAVNAFSEALKEWTQEKVPLDWAGTHSNLGNALLEIGRREGRLDFIERAVVAYHNTLMEWTRELVPLDWALTMNNLGNAMLSIGQRESGTAHLEKAVAAYNNALLERTHARNPLDWALTMNNLGNAFKAIGERESGTERLEQAVTAYGEALNVLTRERMPLQWAVIQNNLGTALQSIGERESGVEGTERLKRAAEAYGLALEVFRAEEAAHFVELAAKNLERVMALIK